MTTYEITFNEKTEKGQSILNFLRENKVKIKDPTKMTEEEFYDKIDRAREQCMAGRAKRLKHKDIDKFLGLE